MKKRGEDLEACAQGRWSRGHLEKNKAGILRALEGVKPAEPARRPTVMVLGAGAASDIPLQELAERVKVILVDLDIEAMRRAVARLPESLRDAVEIEQRDITGDVILRLAKGMRQLQTFNLKDSKYLSHRLQEILK